MDEKQGSKTGKGSGRRPLLFQFTHLYPTCTAKAGPLRLFIRPSYLTRCRVACDVEPYQILALILSALVHLRDRPSGALICPCLNSFQLLHSIYPANFLLSIGPPALHRLQAPKYSISPLVRPTSARGAPRTILPSIFHLEGPSPASPRASLSYPGAPRVCDRSQKPTKWITVALPATRRRSCEEGASYFPDQFVFPANASFPNYPRLCFCNEPIYNIALF